MRHAAHAFNLLRTRILTQVEIENRYASAQDFNLKEIVAQIEREKNEGAVMEIPQDNDEFEEETAAALLHERRRKRVRGITQDIASELNADQQGQWLLEILTLVCRGFHNPLLRVALLSQSN